VELDLERVVCRLADIGCNSARAFAVGGEERVLKGFIIRVGEAVYGYVNRCPHAGHPLDLLPGRFLTPDETLILCSSHGALFEKRTGYCVAGPCAGRTLTPVALEIRDGYVVLAEAVDVAALADAPT
jgi:nitrite reductase/ring-hydroxylating ferredoxin subunit